MCFPFAYHENPWDAMSTIIHPDHHSCVTCPWLGGKCLALIVPVDSWSIGQCLRAAWETFKLMLHIDDWNRCAGILCVLKDNDRRFSYGSSNLQLDFFLPIGYWSNHAPSTVPCSGSVQWVVPPLHWWQCHCSDCFLRLGRSWRRKQKQPGKQLNLRDGDREREREWFFT